MVANSSKSKGYRRSRRTRIRTDFLECQATLPTRGGDIEHVGQVYAQVLDTLNLKS